MTEQLRGLIIYGRASFNGGDRPVYKLVGNGTADNYQMVLEVFDDNSALVSKFTLDDVHRAVDKEEGVVPESHTDWLAWLEAAFGGGSPDGVGVGRKGPFNTMVLTGNYNYISEGEPTPVHIRLPPRGAPIKELSKGSSGFDWVVKDIVNSVLDALDTYRLRLADCLEHQQTAPRQLVRLSDFILGVLAGEEAGPWRSGGAATPTKRVRPGAETPPGDVGSAMKQRPAAAAAAVAARSNSPKPSGIQAPSVLPTVAEASHQAPSVQVPAASDQPTVGGAAEAAPTQSEQTAGASHGSSFIKPKRAQPGVRAGGLLPADRGRGRGRGRAPGK